MLTLNSIVVLALQDLTVTMTCLWSMPFKKKTKKTKTKKKTNKENKNTELFNVFVFLLCFVFVFVFLEGLDHKQVIVTFNGITLLSTGERCLFYHVVSSANYLHAQLLL